MIKKAGVHPPFLYLCYKSVVTNQFIMPRPKHQRKMLAPPPMVGYKPFGIPGRSLQSVCLLLEEYETIRLLDYEHLTQEQAALRMGVSRPTLTRIYDQARKTIAKAFVEGKMIEIGGGNVDFDRKWYRCRKCHRVMEEEASHKPCGNCNQLGDEALEPINPEK